ncbi:aldo/keto reductase family protein [Sarocladium implicatum]|nr:aldo/keto reductase family protein [Sarocladium implicatum]
MGFTSMLSGDGFTPLPPAPPARSPLGRYRYLSPSAGVRVSPIALGGMNFGDRWKPYMGECDQATTESILDFYYDQGGNFIDTSPNYQFQDSERWIGAWMKKRGVRDQIVLATKYSINFLAGEQPPVLANFGGNNSKNMALSVNNSLRNLQTDYIDILYVHVWEYSTSIPELMQSLNHLVAAGKVLYLGIADSPAWVVSKANEYARSHGLRQFSIYQGKWSAASRDIERDILPMCHAEGMALAAWGALGGGMFKTEEQMRVSAESGRQDPQSDQERAVSRVLERIAERETTAITSVALAYVMHKTPYVFPVIGGRKLEHLKSNIEALTLSLSEEDVKAIDKAAPFDYGWPHTMLWGVDGFENYQEVGFVRMNGQMDLVPQSKPIKPSKGGE